ncbi:ribonuclease catalytic domain-containing protein [Treponema primitia]|uniref:ribonuclease catalytic domain-containing protein n=1 Tax=Treponema primitia TaxID=88058 RepID=UPI0002555434|nr:RNB domain-containing ribonuclease [Treponema primitia]
MISEKSLVAYKNKPALVIEANEKITISLAGGEKLKVREKDIEFLHHGPCSQADIEALFSIGTNGGETADIDIRGAWDLLQGNTVPLRDLAELAYGAYTVQSAWTAYGLLKEGLYFTGDIKALTSRDAAAVAADAERRNLKQRDQADRGAFLDRLKSLALDLPADSHFLQDVEALAYGRTEKSRTLRDLGRQEIPQEAHRLLLSAGVWTPWVNPHPQRFGLSLSPARFAPAPPPADEPRTDLTHLEAYAIDSPWSNDPDDAISLEKHPSGDTLYVHIADPAASILPGSPADIEARGRGATLYLPEGAVRMLTDEALSLFALGLSDGPTPRTGQVCPRTGQACPALTFKLILGEDGSILETDIFPSLVRITRLSYAQADVTAGAETVLAGLSRVAERNKQRRIAAGAVMIDLPEAHISVHEEKVAINLIETYKSAETVRECMLLAGEGAARWALQRHLPFPFVSQETGELPTAPLPGMAGSYQLRRCMRPRTLSTKPGLHWGLGLEQYTQVTSPLRRYTDLLAHQQIRAFLKTGAYGDCAPRVEEEILVALAAGEAAAAATVQAERTSRAHWTAVYLMDKKDSQWEGIVMEKKGSQAVVMIPALALETQLVPKGDTAPNDILTLSLSSVKIPESEAVFGSTLLT